MDENGSEAGEPTTRKLFDGSGVTLREAQLVVLDGSQAGRAIPLRDHPLRIGSGADNDLVLSDPSISRHHAIVEPRKEGIVLCDLESTNGTFVNGIRVREGVLTHETILTLGTTSLRFERSASAVDVPPSSATSFGRLVGRSPSMRRLFTVLERAAPTEATILISGPSGTGKELVAQAIHEHSQRSRGPFVVLDCGAIDSSLISSELFGHEAGAFTGATGRRAGVFEQAAGGTVFLDEIGELARELQPKLLRLLESRTLKRLGGNALLALDVRVISATNRNMEQMVTEGTFREDLFYRLSQLQICLPSLDSRKEDVPLLAQAILDRLPSPPGPRRLSTEALARLWLGSFPGNVRQLRNIVERAAMISTGETIEAEDLLLTGGPGPGSPAGTAATRPSQTAPEGPPGSGRPRDEAERLRIMWALEENAQVLSRAALALGIAVNTLKARMKRLQIPIPQRPGMPGPRPADES